MDTHHWYRRVLPVTALVVGLVAVLALVFPGVREQLALSATHQPQEYVALSFARDHAGTVVVCTGTGSDATVSFTVDSEMRQIRTVDYVLTVGTVRRSGTVEVEPGQSVDVTRVLPRPAAGYDVAVRLPGLDRRILAHCPGETR